MRCTTLLYIHHPSRVWWSSGFCRISVCCQNSELLPAFCRFSQSTPRLVFSPFAASDLFTSSVNVSPFEFLRIAKSSTATVDAVPLPRAEGCQRKRARMLSYLFLFAFSVIVANSQRFCLGFSHKWCSGKAAWREILLLVRLAVLPW